jgi:hypothetical protein
MLTELFRQESNSVFSVQCGICKVVRVRAMQAFRGMEVQLHTQPQHYSKLT